MSDELNMDGWARPDERPFLRRALDLSTSVKVQRQWRLTDFLSPREQHLLQSVVSHEGVMASLYGGSEHAERKRALLMPEDWYPETKDYKVGVLYIRHAASEQKPFAHGSVLGAVLGTGLERRKIGDIAVQENGAYIMVCQEIHSFLCDHLTSVGRESITVEIVDGNVSFAPPSYNYQFISVMSLRADAVLAQSCRISRTSAQQYVQKGAVSLNFAELSRVDESIAVGDLLSVRGFGRIRVAAIEGESKKGRLRIKVGILPSDRR